MAKLRADLKRNPHEQFLRSDLIEGIRVILKVVIEFGGAITVMFALANVLYILSGVFTWLGIAIAPSMAQKIMAMAMRAYLTASEADRKSIRAVAAWINGGFSFERFHTPEAYAKIIKAAEIAEKADNVLTKLSAKKPAAKKSTPRTAAKKTIAKKTTTKKVAAKWVTANTAKKIAVKKAVAKKSTR